jgi:hypothetical protein
MLGLFRGRVTGRNAIAGPTNNTAAYKSSIDVQPTVYFDPGIQRVTAECVPVAASVQTCNKQ